MFADAITADVNAAANEIIVDDDLPQPQPETEHQETELKEIMDDAQDTSTLIAEAVAAATKFAADEGKQSSQTLN